MDLTVQYRYSIVLLAILLAGCVQDGTVIKSWQEPVAVEARISKDLPSDSPADICDNEPSARSGDGGQEWNMSVMLTPSSRPVQVSIIPERPGAAPTQGAVTLLVTERGEGSCPFDWIDIPMHGGHARGSVVLTDTPLYGMEAGAIAAGPVLSIAFHQEENYTWITHARVPPPEEVEGDYGKLGNGSTHAVVDRFAFPSGYMYWQENFGWLSFIHDFRVRLASSGDGYFHVRVFGEADDIEPRVWAGGEIFEPVRFRDPSNPDFVVFDWPIQLDGKPPWDIHAQADGKCLHLHYERISGGVRETARFAEEACFAS